MSSEKSHRTVAIPEALSGTPQPFQLTLNADDLGHTLVAGPPTSGMSTLGPHFAIRALTIMGAANSGGTGT